MNGRGNPNEAEFLIVPTNLQAYVVGEARANEPYNLTPAPCSETELKDWYLERKYIFRPIEKELFLESLERGVHLHWAIPAALTHSIHKEHTENPEQPYVPNRWLVLRMAHARGKADVSTKGWVVESDYPSAEPAGNHFIFVGTPPPAELKSNVFGYVGRFVETEKWSESHPAYYFHLTSSGWGDPSFSAYYPACKGIFGFHDRLKDDHDKDLPSPCYLTYLVLGWYSDPDRDPLHPQSNWKDVDEFKRRLMTLGWSCNIKGLPASALPVRTLCSGSVVGVSWQPDLKYDSFSLPKDPKMAIGGSSSEAMAALLATSEQQQEVLCAFQEGHALQVSEPDQLEELLHRQGFSAVAGGTLWTLEPEDQNANPRPAITTISSDVRTTLNHLNEAQRALDELIRKQDSQRWRLFASWVQDPTQSSISQVVDADSGQQKKVEDGQKAVGQALKAANIPMKPNKSGIPPFVQPKDPFLVIQIDKRDLDGMDRTRPQVKDAGSTKSGDEPPLPCRLAAQVISGLHLNRLDYDQRWQAGEDGYLCLDFSKVASAIPRTLAKKLALETLLFDPDTPAPIPKGRPPIDPDLFLSLKRSGLSRSDKKKGDLSWIGPVPTVGVERPDQLALTFWGGASRKTNPFFPVFLMWRANWSPAYATTSDSPGHTSALAGWQLTSNDLLPSESPPHYDLENYVELEGTTIISCLSGKGLADRIEEFAKSAAPKLTPMLSRIPEQVLGQSLGGLNELLLRRILGLFLPPLKDGSVDTTVWSAMKQIPQPFMPDTERGRFLPVRSGALKLVDVWIVDAFGQILKLINHAAATDRPQAVVKHTGVPDKLPQGYHIRFAPRLVQPARLNFEWDVEMAKSALIRVSSHQQHAKVAADSITVRYELINSALYARTTPRFSLQLDGENPLTTTTNEHHFMNLTPGHHTALIHLLNANDTLVQDSRTEFHFTVVPQTRANEPDSGPLCGWIVPNYLEQNFAVFSACGEPLGFLQNYGAVARSGNPQLNRFLNLLNAFLPAEWTAFCALVESVLRKTGERIPPKDPMLAVLLGRPLALVRACLGFEFRGLPAGYWTDQMQFVTEDFERLRVPVRLGGLNLSADGLVGYIADEGDACLFATAGASPTVDSGRIKFTQELTVAAADKEPISLMLLMDPGARVHAACGILPRNSLVLHPEIAGLSSVIEEVSFSVAPVLCDRPRTAAWLPTMPRPSDAFGRWSWATRPAINASSWLEVRQADDRARFAGDLALLEGSLKLRLKQDQNKAPR